MSGPTAGYTPKRTQYPFEAARTYLGIRYKSQTEIIKIQTQWNTFERVENYNDIIYQQFEKGLRNNTYYSYASSGERQDYFSGRYLHEQAYSSDPNTPWYIPASAFCPISDRPMPNVPILTSLPIYSNRDPCVPQRYVPTSSELQAQNLDLSVYTYVSTFNSAHVIQYAFQSDDEKMAYLRAQSRLNSSSYGRL